MALQLKSASPAQGARWLRDGFRLFGRSPLAFSLLFVSFLATALLASMLPLLGPVLLFCAMPLVSLGFMVAAESSLAGGRVHPGQFITPLRGDAQKRRSLLVLCGLHGLALVVAMALSDAVDGGAFDALVRSGAQGQRPQEVEALVGDPRLAQGLALRFGLMALLSVPFWHAPALVHWGGQGPAQALFSSTLAMWRNKAAFIVYLVAWVGMIGLFGVVTSLLAGLLNARQIVGHLTLPAGLVFSTVFYVSLIFTFHDSFGGTEAVVSAP